MIIFAGNDSAKGFLKNLNKKKKKTGGVGRELIKNQTRLGN